jgi:hypothetical protein
MKITALKPLPGHRLWLRFADGTEGTVDLSGDVGVGVFALWRDPAAFAAVRLGDAGQPVWSDLVDLCPDTLYLKVTGLTPADLYPALAERNAHA